MTNHVLLGFVLLFFMMMDPGLCDEIKFTLNMARIEDNKIIHMSKRHAHKWDYDFYKYKENKWISTKSFKVFDTKLGKGLLSAEFEGEQGKYKILKNATVLSPYRCDKVIEVNSDYDGKNITITHDVLPSDTGMIKLVSERNTPIENVKISTVYRNVRFNNDSINRKISNTSGVTDVKGEVKFSFIKNNDKFLFKIFDSKVGTGNKPIYINFSSERLSHGAIWKVEENPVRAEFIILYQDDNTNRKLSYNEVKTFLGNSPLLPIFKKKSDGTYTLFTNACKIDSANGKLIFRNLPENQVLKLGDEIKGSDRKFSVESVDDISFKLLDGAVHKGSILLKHQKKSNVNNDIYNLRIILQNADDKKVSGALVKVTKEIGDSTSFKNVSDESGVVKFQLTEGEYVFKILHTNYKPYSITFKLDSDLSKLVQLPSLDKVNVEIKWQDGENKTSGELFVFTEKRMYPVMVVALMEQNVIRIPFKYEGNTFLNFQSRPNAQNVNFFERSHYMANKEYIPGREKKIILEIGPALEFPVSINGGHKQSCKILIFQEWRERLLPVGVGYWSFENEEKRYIRVPNYGRYSVLFVTDSQVHDNENIMAIWGDDIILKKLNNPIEINLDKSSTHNFRGPFEYKLK